MAYIVPQDLRDEGITLDEAHDNRIIERIALAQSLIETLTGRFFEKKTDYNLIIDGNGSSVIILDIPPVSVDSISEIIVNDEVLSSDYYKVIMPNPDSRLYPKLKRISGIWPKGLSNIEITGDFGFIEGDETPPIKIKRLCKKIAIWGLPKIGDADTSKAGKIIEESLGDYSYKLAEAASSGVFGDGEIDMLINIFRVKRMRTI